MKMPKYAILAGALSQLWLPNCANQSYDTQNSSSYAQPPQQEMVVLHKSKTEVLGKDHPYIADLEQSQNWFKRNWHRHEDKARQLAIRGILSQTEILHHPNEYTSHNSLDRKIMRGDPQAQVLRDEWNERRGVYQDTTRILKFGDNAVTLTRDLRVNYETEVGSGTLRARPRISSNGFGGRISWEREW